MALAGMKRALYYKMLRGAVAAAIAAVVTAIQEDPTWMVLIPVVQMAGKWIREKKPNWAWAVPF